MKDQIPPRIYQGPRQEKQYRKNQRQLLQREQIVDNIIDEHKQLVTIPKPVLDIPRVVLPKYKPKTDWIMLGYGTAVFVVAALINASVAYQLGNTQLDKIEMAVLGALFETGLFLLPDKASTLWKQRRWIH